MPYIVTIDRPNCIADGSCTAVCPEIFELSSEDGLAQIVQEYREENKLEEGIVPDNLADCAIRAADICPVSIIIVNKV